jgi:uncharacterized protein (UPF0332 family)
MGEELKESKKGCSSSIITLSLPRVLFERLKMLDVDIESKIVDYLLQELKLNPNEEFEIHVELARKFLEEGKKMFEENPVQACEKLYKAAEEAIRALAIKHNIKEIIRRVGLRGRWKTDDFFDTVNILKKTYGDDIRRWWNTAWTLHVWGFHEAKATKEYVEANIQDIEHLVNLLVRDK